MVGGLVAYELDKLERAVREVYIYDLAVAEVHCRRGIATALIEHVRAIASDRGATIAFIQAHQGDNRAIALYEKFGSGEIVADFEIPVR